MKPPKIFPLWMLISECLRIVSLVLSLDDSQLNSHGKESKVEFSS